MFCPFELIEIVSEDDKGNKHRQSLKTIFCRQQYFVIFVFAF